MKPSSFISQLAYLATFCWIALMAVPINCFAQWYLQNSNSSSDFYSVHFPTTTLGWAGGVSGAISNSTNNGADWSAQTSNTMQNRGAIYFTDTNNGVAVGPSAIISTTTNGGSTWSGSQFSGVSGNTLHDIHFPSSTTGYIVGNQGTILKTTTGVNGWTNISIGVSTRYRGVHFVSTSTGWIVGTGGKIRITINGGSTWDDQVSMGGITFHDVFFINSTTGWAVGTDGTIMKTTNGVDWSAQTSGVSVILKGVSFADANNGWAVGELGVILRTEDGGATWYQQPAEVYEELYGVQAFDSQTAIAVGANGTILKTINGGGFLLPVTLQSFKVYSRADNVAELHWQTSTEINNKGFDIEWSTDGKNWQPIGFVAGKGNSQTLTSYQYLHRSPKMGENYYRLKQIDWDGSFEYSAVRVVYLEKNQLITYPNPATGVVFLSGPAPIESVEVLSISGKLVSAIKGENITQLSLADLDSGLYIIKVTTKDTILQNQVVLLK
jgi:photosystem II stability/assembly factor-like uncharacterized protein